MTSGERLRTMVIQDEGGTRATVERGVRLVTELLEIADGDRRRAFSAARLKLGLECGGSDGYSGITGNPAAGIAFDLLVAAGAACIFEETGELIGCEDTNGAAADDPGQKPRAAYVPRWWHFDLSEPVAEVEPPKVVPKQEAQLPLPVIAPPKPPKVGEVPKPQPRTAFGSSPPRE